MSEHYRWPAGDVEPAEPNYELFDTDDLSGADDAESSRIAHDLDYTDRPWREEAGFTEPDAHKTYTFAGSRQQYIDYLTRMQRDLSPAHLTGMLNAIKAGEPEPLQQLMLVYAARLLAGGEDRKRPIVSSNSDDALSTGMLKLGLAIVELAQYDEQERPEDAWESIEQWIRSGGVFQPKPVADEEIESVVMRSEEGRQGELPPAYTSLSDKLEHHSPRSEGMLSKDQAAVILNKLRNAAGKS